MPEYPQADQGNHRMTFRRQIATLVAAALARFFAFRTKATTTRHYICHDHLKHSISLPLIILINLDDTQK